MEIANDLAVVLRRIDAIVAGPSLVATDFDALVASGLDRLKDRSPRTATLGSRAAIDRLINANAVESNIDPALIEAIVSNESGFDPNATSRGGARGLMQLMPQTAAGLGVTNSYDPGQNVRGGTRYLRSLLDRFGETELAVAAYNAGPAAVERFGGVPPYAETQRYVRNVLVLYRELKVRGHVVAHTATSR